MQIERLANRLDPDPSLTGDAAITAFFELESRNTRALLERRRDHLPGESKGARL
jgi:hypothetical protein